MAEPQNIPWGELAFNRDIFRGEGGRRKEKKDPPHTLKKKKKFCSRATITLSPTQLPARAPCPFTSILFFLCALSFAQGKGLMLRSKGSQLYT